MPTESGPRLARFITRNRSRLAKALFRELTTAETTRYVPPEGEPLDAWVDRNLGSLVDLFCKHIETGDPAYLALFTGDIRWAFRDLPVSREERLGRRRATIENIRRAVLDLAAKQLTTEDQRTLEQTMDSVVSRVVAQPAQRSSVLLIGDCFVHDIMAFLDEGCVWDDISLEPVLLNANNAAELRNRIREQTQTGRSFDVVFYAPFTYASSIQLRRLYGPLAGLANGRAVETLVAEAVRAVKPSVELLANLFECPVFVHNASMIQRFEPTLKSRLKARSSRAARQRAAALLKPLMEQVIVDVNAAGAGNVRLIDETALVAEHGETRLASFYHTTPTHHAAVIGGVAAAQYRDRALVQARLASKKVVVIDLDNTIWDGIIGEGAVVPFLDRQKALKKLRQRGVLLAVNSKNDPRNVRYEGGALSKDDFVCEEISWELKVSNMRRIQQGLNLKTKDFVFVDDREDEREMMRQTFPEIVTLDATQDRTWTLLDLWGEILPPEPDGDRTQMYKERERRESFLASNQNVVEDDRELFKKLRIRVDIRTAKRGELPRVAELINRTNQFNVNGARTTLRALQEWLACDSHHVLTAAVSDKFGDSGVVCVCVVELAPTEIRIPVFVLSCRVFGYAVEHAVMNHVKRQLCDNGPNTRPIAGAFAATQHNQPCHRFYPESGFDLVDGRYLWSGRAGKPDADWLTISAETIDG
jgi:FkbH-like protein